MEKTRLLIIDDDPKLRELLFQFLTKNKFEILQAKDGKEGLQLASKNFLDLIIVDRMMPNIDGIEFIKKLRKKSNFPVLMLTALGETDHKITGLEAGADDYLVKPFEPKELLLRIKNILKRTKTNDIISLGNDFFYNKNSKVLKQKNEEIKLGATDKIILDLLAKTPNFAITKELLAEKLGIAEQGISVQILRLRKKINDDDGNIIETIRHKGYRLKEQK
ncbi:MAG: response regulator transcription factor [Alphaproteobacteria bacterium]|nr:MAG: hypothetical protein B6I23_01245 [Rickettsiaceae bacterium 4572_127]